MVLAANSWTRTLGTADAELCPVQSRDYLDARLIQLEALAERQRADREAKHGYDRPGIDIPEDPDYWSQFDHGNGD